MNTNQNILIFFTAVSVLFISALFISCSSSSGKNSSEELEGWRTSDEVDIFYMKISGTASMKAVLRNDFSMKKTTCVESTGLQAKDRVLRGIFGDYIVSASEFIEEDSENFVIEEMHKGTVKGVQMKDCASLLNNWQNCECVYYIQGPGLKHDFDLKIEKAQEDFYNQ